MNISCFVLKLQIFFLSHLPTFLCTPSTQPFLFIPSPPSISSSHNLCFICLMHSFYLHFPTSYSSNTLAVNHSILLDFLSATVTLLSVTSSHPTSSSTASFQSPKCMLPHYTGHSANRKANLNYSSVNTELKGPIMDFDKFADAPAGEKLKWDSFFLWVNTFSCKQLRGFFFFLEFTFWLS